MEWEEMEAVPVDLSDAWVSVLCPAGARCIVVASKVAMMMFGRYCIVIAG